MQTWRLIRHATATHWRTRLLFSARPDVIEQAIAGAELTHAGEIRFAIETALTPLHILNGDAAGPRASRFRAFARLGHRTQQRCVDLCPSGGPGRGNSR
jgi:hypothetical protein